MSNKLPGTQGTRTPATRGKQRATVNPLAKKSFNTAPPRTEHLNALAKSLDNGRCRRSDGLIAMDDYISAPQNAGNTQRAREVCYACPVMRQCEEYIRLAEPRAGEWAGMYAAMTPRDRKERAAHL